ncbi:MAG: FRG domain-containing protein [Clostridia bacterium]|nr:FRG domain-containing protein [Clostridia bacterium]
MAGMLENLEFDVSTFAEKGVRFFEEEEILQCKIDSFSAFEYLISSLGRGSYHYDCTWDRFYRGVSNKEYDLICSLCVNNLEDKEADIINSLYSRAPDEFSSCKTDFEMVALMQHYGLPTRLLDFTRNPMIALWFACQRDTKCKLGEADGAVYLAFSSRNTPKKIVDSIFKMALADDIDKAVDLRNIFSKSEIYDYILVNEIHCNHMLFLDAPIIDLRERNQQAVFLLGVNDILMSEKSSSNEKRLVKADNFIEALSELSNENSSIRFDLGEIHCYQKNRDSDKVLKIIIPKELKRELLYELSVRGIDETFIYPTLDNYCKEIKRQARHKHDVSEEKWNLCKKYLLEYAENSKTDMQ